MKFMEAEEAKRITQSAIDLRETIHYGIINSAKAGSNEYNIDLSETTAEVEESIKKDLTDAGYSISTKSSNPSHIFISW